MREHSGSGAAENRSAAPLEGRRAGVWFPGLCTAGALLLVGLVVVLVADSQGEPGWTPAGQVGFTMVVAGSALLVSLGVVDRIRRRSRPASRTRADRPRGSTAAAGSPTTGSRAANASHAGRGARPGSASDRDRTSSAAPAAGVDRDVVRPVVAGVGASARRPRGRRPEPAVRARSVRGDGARLLFFLGLVVLGVGMGVEETGVFALGLAMLAIAVAVRPAGVRLTEGYGRLATGRRSHGEYPGAGGGSSGTEAGDFSGGGSSGDPGGDSGGGSSD